MMAPLRLGKKFLFPLSYQTLLTFIISLNNFLVGSSEDDDVFTVGSNDNLTQESASRGVTNVASYQDLRDKVDPQTMYAGSSCMFVAK